MMEAEPSAGTEPTKAAAHQQPNSLSCQGRRATPGLEEHPIPVYGALAGGGRCGDEFSTCRPDWPALGSRHAQRTQSTPASTGLQQTQCMQSGPTCGGDEFSTCR